MPTLRATPDQLTPAVVPPLSTLRIGRKTGRNSGGAVQNCGKAQKRVERGIAALGTGIRTEGDEGNAGMRSKLTRLRWRLESGRHLSSTFGLRRDIER